MADRARWLIPAPDPGAVAALREALGLATPAASVLCHRGYGDAAAARRFLTPTLADLHDPLLMRDMEPAVTRLRQAIERREPILLYGDYDVDGTISVVILAKAIELAGGVSTYHLPHRLRDGYGMRPEVVESAAASGVRLIVSADTGIRAGEVVARANELGVDIIVTDHHLPEERIPPARAVLNPTRPGCAYPEKNLCGAGVVFKLIQALLPRLGWAPARVERLTASFLKLVAIATVADVVPLSGENRVIVRQGLEGLRSVNNAGLRALLDVAGFPAGTAPTARQVAFQVAPRLNAAGRMDTAGRVVELFLTSDAARAGDLARQLHEQNSERQQVEAEVRAICEQVAVGETDWGLVYYGETWHRGVVGIVASRLVERFHRPVFVLGRDAESGLAQGSGRSIPAFHLLEALEAMADLFVRFGGHRHAAGVTLEAGRVDEFRRRFNDWAAAHLTPDDLLPEHRIDAVVSPQDLDEISLAQILALAPFGYGNPTPCFAALDVEVAGPPVVWNDRHMRVAVRREGRSLMLKAWNQAARAAELAPGARVDVVFAVEEDPYSAARGYPPWTAVLRDFRPATCG